MISVDVSNTNIYVAEFTGKGDKRSCVGSRSLLVTEMILSQDNQLDKEKLVQYLTKALNDFKSKDVAVTFSSLHVVSNEYVFPYIKDPNQRLEMVKAKVYQNLSADEYIMDYKITNIFTEDNKQVCHVITYVAPRKLVQDTAEILKSLGKKPVMFSITQNSIMNFVEKYVKEERIILVNATQHQTLLHLVNRPNAIITRSVVSGERDELSALGFSSETQNVNTMVLDQISKLIQFQTIKYAGAQVDRIYLSGAMADESLAAYIRDNVSVDVALISDLKLAFASSLNLNHFIYAISAAV